jgi:hypothetical protein
MNCAGVAFATEIRDITPEEWNEALATILTEPSCSARPSLAT